MKRLFNRLFKRPMRIVITFTPGTNGHIRTAFKVSKNIPVGYALTALSRMRADIDVGVVKKAKGEGLTFKDTQTRGFIRKQTLGDVL